MSGEIKRLDGGANAMPERLSHAENRIRKLAMDILLERSAVDGNLACLSVLRIARAMEAEAAGMYEALYGSFDEQGKSALSSLSGHHHRVGLETGADLLSQRRRGCH